MEDWTTDDLRLWSNEEIKEGIKNNSLNPEQIKQAKNLLTRFSPLPKYARERLMDELATHEKKMDKLGTEADPFERMNLKLQLIGKAYSEIEALTDKKFRATLKTIKSVLKSENLILPKDWKEVFVGWYLDKKGMVSYLESIYDLPIQDRTLIIEWARDYSKSVLKDSSKPELTEKLKNLPHKLCILDDLGILDLIAEKFANKSYLGRARETDKARLIASLLNIEDASNIREALKNKDYLSNVAKQRSKKTLEQLGLKSIFDED